MNKILIISYFRGLFAFWVGNIQVTNVSGSDHPGEFRIGGNGQVKMQYTRVESANKV